MSEQKSHMQSVSEAFRSRAHGFDDAEGAEDLVETNQVQKISASEHAGGHDADGNPRGAVDEDDTAEDPESTESPADPVDPFPGVDNY